MVNFLLRFKVESIFTPKKYFRHLQDGSSGFVIRNENCGVDKELAALVKTLKETKHTARKKKRSISVCLLILKTVVTASDFNK